MTKKRANPKPTAKASEQDVGTSSKDKGKGIAVEGEAPAGKEKVIESCLMKYTPTEIFAKLEDITFAPTRYPHVPTLTALGLLDDYDQIVDNMGLKTFFTVSSDGYQSSACQFLSTMKTTVNMRKTALRGEVSRGEISFMVGRKKIIVTFEEIASIFGFQENGAMLGCSIPIDKEDLQDLWFMIANGPYKAGGMKSARLRHPAIRYVHKALAHTLFARKEANQVTDMEMKLLYIGLQPLLLTFPNGKPIPPVERLPSYTSILVEQFAVHRDWGTSVKDDEPKFNMGGLITPILSAKKVKLEGSLRDKTFGQPTPVAWLDEPQLIRTHYLGSKSPPGRHLYRMCSDTEYEEKFLLPNPTITSFTDRANIRFMPGMAHQFKPYVPRRAPAAGSDSPDAPAGVYGLHRYLIEPLDEPIANKTVSALRDQNRDLQRQSKWHGRNIKKMASCLKKVTNVLKMFVGKKDKSAVAGQTSTSRETQAGVDEELRTATEEVFR